MPFKLEGEGPEGPLRGRRVQLASALVLADKWTSVGARNVVIENDGEIYEVEVLRQRLIRRRNARSYS